MKAKVSSIKTWVLISVIVISLMLVSVLVSCNKETVEFYGSYPNKIAENAQISKEYKELADQLSEATLSQLYDISKVPRESGNMDGIRNYILNWAKTNNINAVLDSSGCIYIDLPSTQGHESDKNLIIQGHLDMVVNTRDDYKEFNPLTTPIEIEYNEETGEVHSKDYKTNMGADNGQAVALGMALAKYQNNFEHGPIRILFTYDEETTMEGSNLLSADLLNADYLINFDAPRSGVACIGAAGDFPIEFTKQYIKDKPTEKNASENMTINVTNLKGGHSGLDINRGRNSSSAFLIKYLNELRDNAIHFRLVSIDCGEMKNSIPDSFTLTLNINKKHEEEAKEVFNKLAEQLKKDCPDDAEFTYDITISQASGMFPSQQDSEKIQNALNALPNGVIKMNDTYKTLVESSCNIGVIKLNDGLLYTSSMYRSSDSEVLKTKPKEISDELKTYKIDYKLSDDYDSPAWPISESSLSNMYIKSMKEACNINASIYSPHACMELSIFHKKKPNMKMISIGGDVKDEHMLTETFYLKSFPAAVCPIVYIINHINELD